MVSLALYTDINDLTLDSLQSELVASVLSKGEHRVCFRFPDGRQLFMRADSQHINRIGLAQYYVILMTGPVDEPERDGVALHVEGDIDYIELENPQLAVVQFARRASSLTPGIGMRRLERRTREEIAYGQLSRVKLAA